MANRINIKNKKAYHDYELIEKYIAGVQLQGTEIKSIRMGKVSLSDSYCVFHKDELYIRGLQIAEYAWASYNNHDPGRERKLLLNRKELNKLLRKVKESGLTIVALRVFVNEKGLAKIEIALARGKKQYDKRETIKRKDTQRQMERLQKIK
ncbi:MAG: SsrA-binding protein [Bacteroidales bacterium]|nr:SsrA-binding protein [Bacteroidales bacterium]MDT8431416.1 SsrA-binding protein [Bacteroidales bacterium]